MAIELEFCTALFPKKLIEEHFPGGIDAFFATCEAANFKEDEHLVGISLMATSYCHELYESLIENGFQKRMREVLVAPWFSVRACKRIFLLGSTSVAKVYRTFGTQNTKRAILSVPLKAF